MTACHSLVRIRWLAVMLEIVVVVLALWQHWPISITGFSTLALLHGAVNVWASRMTAHFLLPLMADTLILTGFLYGSGGAGNPFVFLLILPLVMVAGMGPYRHVVGMAVMVVLCYTMLLLNPKPVPGMSLHDPAFSQHVLGMWLGFLLACGIVVGVVARLAAHVRKQQRELAASHERSLKQQHLINLGTVATAAVHDLSTPLASMAVISRELQCDHADIPSIVAYAELFDGQLQRCKAILSRLSERYGQGRAESACAMLLDQHARDTVDSWQEKNQRQISVRLMPAEKNSRVPRIFADQALTQNLHNLLDNAAAMARHIELQVHWNEDRLIWQVTDDGPGFAPEVLPRLGTPFLTTRKNGQGLGLYLARLFAERYNGQLLCHNRPEGGACVRLDLPHAALSCNA